jgi:GTPase
MEIYKDLKISLVGNVDSGKSTLTGVLTKGILDDGNGYARSYVLKHNHERVRGQTSSIGTELIGFDINGKHIIPSNPSSNIKDRKLKEYKEVSFKSHKKVLLVDLCGHQKYLKTTLNGLCSYTPDHSMVIIAANSGVVPRMTLEHMNTCYVLGIPFFIVLTKIDMAPENIYNETLSKIEEFINRYKKRPNLTVTNVPNVPIFKVSNRTGEGIEELINYIRILSKELEPVQVNLSEKIDFIIENKYQVPGVGIVVGGFLESGIIREGQILFLGPNYYGEFDRIQIRSIQRQCIPTTEIYKDQQSTMSIKFVDKKKIDKKIDKYLIRKGSRIMEIPEGLIDEFDATVKILRHSTGIQEGYESVIHIGNVSQTAKVIKIYESTIEPKLGSLENGIPNNILRMGSTGKIRLKFIRNKECIKIGTMFIFREGNCKGVGTVVEF